MCQRAPPDTCTNRLSTGHVASVQQMGMQVQLEAYSTLVKNSMMSLSVKFCLAARPPARQEEHQYGYMPIDLKSHEARITPVSTSEC